MDQEMKEDQKYIYDEGEIGNSGKIIRPMLLLGHFISFCLLSYLIFIFIRFSMLSKPSLFDIFRSIEK